MNYQLLESVAREDSQTKQLLEDMRKWSIQRLQSLCLDQSDLELVQAIISQQAGTPSSCQIP